jgi:putative ABC transport system permease protein
MRNTSDFALRPIWNIGWRYLLRHHWQTGLMILGITLGVAVVVAIDLANASALRAFNLSTETVAGRATHQIIGGPLGLDETTYASLKKSGVTEAAAPVISEYVSSPELGGSLIQLLGIDPFADAPFRDYLGGKTGNQPRQPVGNLISFLTKPGAILISTDLAERYGLAGCARSPTGCEISLEIAGEVKPAVITGLLQPDNNLSRRAMENLIITDIATAQELTGRIGKIDRIDLILPENGKDALESQIKSLLPANVRVVAVEARQGTIREMTSAFRVNLTALSLLALVVGLFLIYNTITFSVVQRRPLFGTLRSLGFTRREIFVMVILEALATGLIGSLLGVGLGLILGQAAVRMVTQTINDLFFVVSVRGVQVPVFSLIKGAALGVTATLLTAAPPAWEAATAPPRMALSRSGLEKKARKAVRLAAIGGLLLLLAGGAALLIPSRDLVLSFAATFAVIIGFALEAPLATVILMRASTPLLGRIWGSLGRMAPRDVVNSLSRTSIAVAALMVAISVTIGVSLMVTSFRSTVVAWLAETLQGDIYVSAPSQTSTQTTTPLNKDVIKILDDWQGSSQLYLLRSVNVDSPLGETHIAAASNPTTGGERRFLSTSVPVGEIAAEMQRGAVIISEPYANRMGIRRPGGEVTLYTDRGVMNFPVVGIYYDYSSTLGTILMDLDTYQSYWNDTAITAAAIKLLPGVNLDESISDLKSKLGPHQRLLIRANQVLRSEVMNVFDRTFAITGALQLLATIVAFIGILSALLSVELERQRELGILRAVGMTIRQLWGLILLETGLMGAVAGILAMPTGYVLASILVYIINRRSFGWTLQMQVPLDPFFLALLVAVGAALLAGIYPALRMSRLLAAEAIRYE